MGEGAKTVYFETPRPETPIPEHQISTEVTFDRGDLSVCPLEVFTGAREQHFSKWGGRPPRGPSRDEHRGHFSLGSLLCFIEDRGSARRTGWGSVILGAKYFLSISV